MRIDKKKLNWITGVHSVLTSRKKSILVSYSFVFRLSCTNNKRYDKSFVVRYRGEHRSKRKILVLRNLWSSLNGNHKLICLNQFGWAFLFCFVCFRCALCAQSIAIMLWSQSAGVPSWKHRKQTPKGMLQSSKMLLLTLSGLSSNNHNFAPSHEHCAHSTASINWKKVEEFFQEKSFVLFVLLKNLFRALPSSTLKT